MQDPTLHLPRVLCLHGGGTNARIFRAQCRKIIDDLKTELRFVFAEASTPCEPGPDVLSAYREWGPFKCWIPWLPSHGNENTKENLSQIHESLITAIQRDDLIGGTGEWVGLLGFSQGARVCASLLYLQQLNEWGLAGNSMLSTFNFAILLAGRGPLMDWGEGAEEAMLETGGSKRSILHIPTLHVQGLRDPGLHIHQQLYELYCSKDSRTLVVWDGDHRVPLKKCDVALVSYEIRRLLSESSGPAVPF